MVERHDLATCTAALLELLAQRVDGLLINVPLDDDDALALAMQAGTTPVLFLDVSPTAAVNSLTFDASEGARSGAQHLLAQGHQKIALLGGPQESVSARARFSGWLETLTLAGIAPCASAHGDWSAASGYEKAHLLLANAQPTAMLVANDQMALGAIRACTEKGISVPGMISIVGYDDTADSAWYTPPLTTVRQAFKEAGQRSVDWLLDSPDAQTPQQVQLPVTLVVRGSTAPVSDSAPDGDLLAQRLNELAQLAVRLGRR